MAKKPLGTILKRGVGPLLLQHLVLVATLLLLLLPLLLLSLATTSRHGGVGFVYARNNEQTYRVGNLTTKAFSVNIPSNVAKCSIIIENITCESFNPTFTLQNGCNLTIRDITVTRGYFRLGDPSSMSVTVPGGAGVIHISNIYVSVSPGNADFFPFKFNPIVLGGGVGSIIVENVTIDAEHCTGISICGYGSASMPAFDAQEWNAFFVFDTGSFISGTDMVSVDHLKINNINFLRPLVSGGVALRSQQFVAMAFPSQVQHVGTFTISSISIDLDWADTAVNAWGLRFTNLTNISALSFVDHTIRLGGQSTSVINHGIHLGGSNNRIENIVFSEVIVAPPTAASGGTTSTTYNPILGFLLENVRSLPPSSSSSPTANNNSSSSTIRSSNTQVTIKDCVVKHGSMTAILVKKSLLSSLKIVGPGNKNPKNNLAPEITGSIQLLHVGIIDAVEINGVHMGDGSEPLDRCIVLGRDSSTPRADEREYFGSISIIDSKCTTTSSGKHREGNGLLSVHSSNFTVAERLLVRNCVLNFPLPNTPASLGPLTPPKETLPVNNFAQFKQYGVVSVGDIIFESNQFIYPWSTTTFKAIRFAYFQRVTDEGVTLPSRYTQKIRDLRLVNNEFQCKATQRSSFLELHISPTNGVELSGNTVMVTQQSNHSEYESSAVFADITPTTATTFELLKLHHNVLQALGENQTTLMLNFSSNSEGYSVNNALALKQLDVQANTISSTRDANGFYLLSYTKVGSLAFASDLVLVIWRPAVGSAALGGSGGRGGGTGIAETAEAVPDLRLTRVVYALLHRLIGADQKVLPMSDVRTFANVISLNVTEVALEVEPATTAVRSVGSELVRNEFSLIQNYTLTGNLMSTKCAPILKLSTAISDVPFNSSMSLLWVNARHRKQAGVGFGGILNGFQSGIFKIKDNTLTTNKCRYGPGAAPATLMTVGEGAMLSIWYRGRATLTGNDISWELNEVDAAHSFFRHGSQLIFIENNASMLDGKISGFFLLRLGPPCNTFTQSEYYRIPASQSVGVNETANLDLTQTVVAPYFANETGAVFKIRSDALEGCGVSNSVSRSETATAGITRTFTIPPTKTQTRTFTRRPTSTRSSSFGSETPSRDSTETVHRDSVTELRNSMTVHRTSVTEQPTVTLTRSLTKIPTATPTSILTRTRSFGDPSPTQSLPATRTKTATHSMRPDVDYSLGLNKVQQQTVTTVVSITNAVAAISAAPTAVLTAERALSLFAITGCPRTTPSGEPWSEAPMSFPKTFFPGIEIGAAVGGHARMAVVGFVGISFVIVLLILLITAARHRRAVSGLSRKDAFAFVLSSAPMPFFFGIYLALIVGYWAQATGLLANTSGQGWLVDGLALTLVPWAGLFVLWYLYIMRVRATLNFSNVVVPSAGLTPCAVYCPGLPRDDRSSIAQCRRKLADLLSRPVGRFLVAGHYCWTSVEDSAGGLLIALCRTVLTKQLGPAMPGNKSLTDTVSDLRLKMSPFAFPILCLLAAVAGFTQGIAKGNMESLCMGALRVLVAVNITAALYTCVCRPFLVPARNVIAGLVDVLIAIASIVALTVTETEAQQGDKIVAVQYICSISVTVGAVVELGVTGVRFFIIRVIGIQFLPPKQHEQLTIRDKIAKEIEIDFLNDDDVERRNAAALEDPTELSLLTKAEQQQNQNEFMMSGGGGGDDDAAAIDIQTLYSPASQRHLSRAMETSSAPPTPPPEEDDDGDDGDAPVVTSRDFPMHLSPDMLQKARTQTTFHSSPSRAASSPGRKYAHGIGNVSPPPSPPPEPALFDAEEAAIATAAAVAAIRAKHQQQEQEQRAALSASSVSPPRQQQEREAKAPAQQQQQQEAPPSYQDPFEVLDASLRREHRSATLKRDARAAGAGDEDDDDEDEEERQRQIRIAGLLKHLDDLTNV